MFLNKKQQIQSTEKSFNEDLVQKLQVVDGGFEGTEGIKRGFEL
jgi:hypothetical protein